MIATESIEAAPEAAAGADDEMVVNPGSACDDRGMPLQGQLTTFTTRRCLRCDGEFPSSGKFNRICNHCSHKNGEGGHEYRVKFGS